MKKLHKSVLTLVTSFLLLGVHNPHHSPLALASNASCDADDNCVAEYQPSEKKRAFGRVLEWGLAKIETAFDGTAVSDLIAALVDKCDRMLAILLRSFGEMTMPYAELLKREVERSGQFDEEFKELAKLRNRIDRKCLYSANGDDRSLCVEKGIEIQGRIRDLRSERAKCADAIERYKEMIEWCAYYGNWFC